MSRSDYGRSNSSVDCQYKRRVIRRPLPFDKENIVKTLFLMPTDICCCCFGEDGRTPDVQGTSRAERGAGLRDYGRHYLDANKIRRDLRSNDRGPRSTGSSRAPNTACTFTRSAVCSDVNPVNGSVGAFLGAGGHFDPGPNSNSNADANHPFPHGRYA